MSSLDIIKNMVSGGLFSLPLKMPPLPMLLGPVHQIMIYKPPSQLLHFCKSHKYNHYDNRVPHNKETIKLTKEHC